MGSIWQVLDLLSEEDCAILAVNGDIYLAGTISYPPPDTDIFLFVVQVAHGIPVIASWGQCSDIQGFCFIGYINVMVAPALDRKQVASLASANVHNQDIVFFEIDQEFTAWTRV